MNNIEFADFLIMSVAKGLIMRKNIIDRAAHDPLTDKYIRFCLDYDPEIRNISKTIVSDILEKYNDGFDLTINEVAAKNWEFCEKNKWHNKTPLEYLALISSEVGEAVNECRGKTPNYINLELELADIILRTLDFAHELGIDMESAIDKKMKINETRDFSLKKY